MFFQPNTHTCTHTHTHTHTLWRKGDDKASGCVSRSWLKAYIVLLCGTDELAFPVEITKYPPHTALTSIWLDPVYIAPTCTLTLRAFFLTLMETGLRHCGREDYSISVGFFFCSANGWALAAVWEFTASTSTHVERCNDFPNPKFQKQIVQ